MTERKTGCVCELNAETGEPVVENYEMCPVHRSEAPDPKDTASLLVNKLYEFNNIRLMSENEKSTAYGIAKLSALAWTSKILSVLDTFQRHEYGKVLIPFYQQVKKEIEAL